MTWVAGPRQRVTRCEQRVDCDAAARSRRSASLLSGEIEELTTCRMMARGAAGRRAFSSRSPSVMKWGPRTGTPSPSPRTGRLLREPAVHADHLERFSFRLCAFSVLSARIGTRPLPRARHGRHELRLEPGYGQPVRRSASSTRPDAATTTIGSTKRSASSPLRRALHVGGGQVPLVGRAPTRSNGWGGRDCQCAPTGSR